MRILSQRGRIDLPYEKVGICINAHNDKEIIAYPIVGNSTEDEYWTLAEYSTEAKARKAMEMLRDAFENYDWIKIMGNSDELKQVARMLGEKQFKKITTAYFQFPADDEVEV